ncbi:MAG TPA: hypothetical protein VGF46_07480 [Gaiellales bacterium]
MARRGPLGALALVVLVASGCGGSGAAPVSQQPDTSDPVAGPTIVTRPIGVGPGYRLASHGPIAARARPIAGLACRPGSLPGPIVAHLEIFARRETLIIPEGIGVVAARCRYPLRTLDPTGLIVASRPGLTLGDLFAVWGQPLGARRLAGFRGPIVAFVGGRRVRGPVARIPIRHHSQIVIEVSGYVPPHAHYVFPRAA